MSKYTAQFKQEVIQYYLSGRGGYQATADYFGIVKSAVRKWVKAYQYHGTLSTVAKYTHYSAEFKQSVLAYRLTHTLSLRETAAKFDIRNPNAIRLWEQAYNLGGIAALTNRKRGRSPMAQQVKTTPNPDINDMTVEQLREELAYRRMENEYLKKLDALIRKEKLAAQKAKRK
jgi:transposase